AIQAAPMLLLALLALMSHLITTGPEGEQPASAPPPKRPAQEEHDSGPHAAPGSAGAGEDEGAEGRTGAHVMELDAQNYSQCGRGSGYLVTLLLGVHEEEEDEEEADQVQVVDSERALDALKAAAREFARERRLTFTFLDVSKQVRSWCWTRRWG
ncbi:hypothetical protein CYMTET_33416, partial [Cymbomonas tetramitiformis]